MHERGVTSIDEMTNVPKALREELRGFEPSAEEFRKIFRAVDPIDHQMHLQAGTAAALSPKQKERLEKQRAAAIQEVLTPQRYQEYQVVKDPVYRRAQITAEQYRAPAAAIMPIYRLTKASEDRRHQIINDPGLTAPYAPRRTPPRPPPRALIRQAPALPPLDEDGHRRCTAREHSRSADTFRPQPLQTPCWLL